MKALAGFAVVASASLFQQAGSKLETMVNVDMVHSRAPSKCTFLGVTNPAEYLFNASARQ